MRTIFIKHPFIVIFCIVLAILILIHLFYGFEYISLFSIYPSDWFNLFLALFFVLIVYVTVDSQTSSKIEQVQKIEQKIEQNTNKLITANNQLDNNIKHTDDNIHSLHSKIQKTSAIQSHIEQNIKELIKINDQMFANIHKTAFQVERTSAVYKYPESEQYKKINENYQPFVLALFDYKKPIIGIIIDPKNSNNDLSYQIEIVRNSDNTPKKATALHSTFYIIKILAPAYSEVLKEENLQKYQNSPIKEGEYYACKFYEYKDYNQCSWVLGQQLSFGQIGQGFYEFYLAGSDVSGGIISSANEIMGCGQDPDNTYQLLEEFIIPFSIANLPITNQSIGVASGYHGPLYKLFKTYSEIFLKIGDSPLKKVYFIETYTGISNRSCFLVFENLRGHIINNQVLKNLKAKIFQYIQYLPLHTIHTSQYEENHHIKIPLDPREIKILKQYQPH